MKITRMIAALAAVSLLLAACGEEDATTEGPEEAPEAAEDDDGDEPAEEATDDGEEAADDGLEALIAAAQEEGELLWYTSIPEVVNDAVAEGFEDAYGISVEYIRLVDGQLTQRFASEQQTGASAVDFMNVAQQAFFTTALEEGWFASVDASDVPSLAEYPADGLFNDTYALLNIQPLGFAYNTDLVDTEPREWEDLTGPEFQDNTLFGDPAIPAYLVLYDMWRVEYGDQYLEDLGALNLSVVESMVPGAQSLAAGEVAMTVPGLASVVNPLIAENAPIEFVIPDTTTGVEQYGGVVSDAPNPNAARLFMHYLLTVEGQERLTNGVAASLLEDVPGALDLPGNYQFPDEAGSLEREDETVALFGL